MLSGGDCATIAGWEWNPAWSSSQGEFCNLYVMRMTNDTHATYEGNGTAAGRQNGWHHEAYRVECEDGAVAVGHDHVVRLYQHRRDGGLTIHEVPSVTPAHQGHRWVIDEFLDWLDGGPTPATELHDNIKSVAMVFGAIDAARTHQTVDVAAMIADLG
jgi:hypothetical protein